MCKGAIKATFVILLAAWLTSCNNSRQKAVEGASAMLTEAKASLEAGDYAKVLELTDSIHSIYPSATDQRREAMHIRSVALEGYVVERLQEVDREIVETQSQGDSLQNRLKFISHPLEGYYVMQGVDNNLEGTTGLQARISNSRQFYIVATTTKSGPFTSVIVESSAARATTSTVPRDGERNRCSGSTEIVNFVGTDADTIGCFIYEHRLKPITLIFNGPSPYSLTMSTEMVDNVASTYQYIEVSYRMKELLLEKEKLERQLEVARNQTARTMLE